MKPDYLTLSDDRRVRIEWNMNALAEYTSLTGREMTDLTAAKADLKILRVIAWCSATEGEAADGRELGLSEIEFGRLMSMKCVIEFSEIISRQINGQKKSPYKERKPLIFFRKKD
jgi:hypothetical protein